MNTCKLETLKPRMIAHRGVSGLERENTCAAFVAAGFLLCGKYGFVLLGCLAGYGLALRKAYKSLDGMNGDISGYALTFGELCAVAVLAIL